MIRGQVLGHPNRVVALERVVRLDRKFPDVQVRGDAGVDNLSTLYRPWLNLQSASYCEASGGTEYSPTIHVDGDCPETDGVPYWG